MPLPLNTSSDHMDGLQHIMQEHTMPLSDRGAAGTTLRRSSTAMAMAMVIRGRSKRRGFSITMTITDSGHLIHVLFPPSPLVATHACIPPFYPGAHRGLKEFEMPSLFRNRCKAAAGASRMVAVLNKLSLQMMLLTAESRSLGAGSRR